MPIAGPYATPESQRRQPRRFRVFEQGASIQAHEEDLTIYTTEHNHHLHHRPPGEPRNSQSAKMKTQLIHFRLVGQTGVDEAKTEILKMRDELIEELLNGSTTKIKPNAYKQSRPPRARKPRLLEDDEDKHWDDMVALSQKSLWWTFELEGDISRTRQEELLEQLEKVKAVMSVVDPCCVVARCMNIDTSTATGIQTAMKELLSWVGYFRNRLVEVADFEQCASAAFGWCFATAASSPVTLSLSHRPYCSSACLPIPLRRQRDKRQTTRSFSNHTSHIIREYVHITFQDRQKATVYAYMPATSHLSSGSSQNAMLEVVVVQSKHYAPLLLSTP